MVKTISYDFQIKTIARYEQSRMINIYQALGYEVTNIAPTTQSRKLLDVTLRRPSDIVHKNELAQLEKTIQNELDVVSNLKRTETKAPKINAYVLGTVGTLTLGGGMSLVLEGHSTATFVTGVVVGIIGIALCAVNDLIYHRFVFKRQNRHYNRVQEAYHKIDDACAEAQQLINGKDGHGRD